MRNIFFIFSVVFLFTQNTFGQLETEAKNKITQLKTLISEAEALEIDVLQEKMTIRVAEVFLEYANWDEANVSENTDYFALVTRYKNNAGEMADLLPNFERSEIILMLDVAIENIKLLNSGEITRSSSPKIDWAQVSISGNQVLFEGKPVFLDDYTWKPQIEKLTEYFGNKDGVFMTPGNVIDASGTIKSTLLSEINGKTDGGTFGSIFLNHKSVPAWAETAYGPGFSMREDTYTAYDIDNPGAKTLQGYLLGGTVPLMAGKKYADLGYMLCNEPHFITTEDNGNLLWASGPVSEYTKVKFRNWLNTKHTSISELNQLWGKNFSSFDAVTIQIPIDKSLLGTPMWYDWQTFNMFRVTEWFTFLKDEIQKYDPNAKTHLKIMPNLWSENGRDHGIDFETLTRQSEIIGNDAGSHNNHMWGPTEAWEQYYNFEWRELSMSYDFAKSVSPNKINYNSEGHFLSTTRARDLYQKPSYARMSYWLAHIQGLNVIQTWFWARRDDGSIRAGAGKGYAGSNNQQPRIVNEVALTMMDLNAHSGHITELQNLRKSIRIFDSKTSAMNKINHMDDEFELYESLYFEGLSLGFATENIIKIENNSDWDVVVIYKTPFVTEDELAALQLYLDNGGTIIVDAESLKNDEYKRPHTKFLKASNGILLQGTSLENLKEQALGVATSKNRFPKITLEETNELNHKGCTWRAYTTSDGKHIISIVNIGKTTATLNLGIDGNSGDVVAANLINGTKLTDTFEMLPETVLLLEVALAEKKNDKFNIKTIGETCPNKGNGTLIIEAEIAGSYKVIFDKTEIDFAESTSLENLAPGIYDVCIKNTTSLQEQCYQFKIEASEKIGAKATFEKNKAIVAISKGTAPFNVFVNNELILKTTENYFEITIVKGDIIEVKTAVSCEGIFTEYIHFDSAYPNPTTGELTLSLNTSKKEVLVEVFNTQSQRVFSENCTINNGRVAIDISDVSNGVYFIKSFSETNSTIKIVKM